MVSRFKSCDAKSEFFLGSLLVDLIGIWKRCEPHLVLNHSRFIERIVKMGCVIHFEISVYISFMNIRSFQSKLLLSGILFGMWLCTPRLGSMAGYQFQKKHSWPHMSQKREIISLIWRSDVHPYCIYIYIRCRACIFGGLARHTMTSRIQRA